MDGEDDNNDTGITGTDVAIAAAAGVAFAWGFSKLFRSSEPETKRHEQMALSSSPSSSRGMGDRNRMEHNNTFGHQIVEASELFSGDRKVKWTRPKEDCYKLNTDASARIQQWEKFGPASAGGVIRNHAGDWILGFSSNLGVRDCTEAELEAVRDGLRLAWEQNFMGVEVETDSEAVVILINNRDVKHDNSRRLVVEQCRNLLTELGSEIIHVHRDANKCADALAKIGLLQNDRFKMFETLERVPNEHVREVFRSDKQLSLRPYSVLR